MKNVSKSTELTVKIGLLSAIALILMYLEFPILPAYSFLKIDLSDVPALIGAFAFGPLAGLLIEAIKNILIVLTKGTQSGGIGEFANFIIGCSFVCTAGFIYKRKKTIKTAIIALVVSIITMAVFGVLANYFVLVPLYFKGITTSATITYLINAVIPFNLIKGAMIAVVTILIYKRVSILLHAESFEREKNTTN